MQTEDPYKLRDSLLFPYVKSDTYLGTRYFYVTNAEKNQIPLPNAYAWEGDTLIACFWSSFSSNDTAIFAYYLPNEPMITGAPFIGYGIIAQQNVTVPAGVFKDCYVLHYQSGNYQTNVWLKRGVGFVKIASLWNDVVSDLWELKSYTLVE